MIKISKFDIPYKKKSIQNPEDRKTRNLHWISISINGEW